MGKTNDLINGKVFTSLIKFAIPVFIAMFLQSLYGGVDLLVVGQFANTEDVSGVATGSLLMQTVTMIITGFSMGITVYVGQKIGENDKKKAGEAIGAGIMLFLLLGIIITALLIIFTGQLATVLHAPSEAFKETCDYITVCGIGTLFISMYNLLGAIFRGVGDSKTPLITVLTACIINIVGDLFFIAVLDLGAKGAALATVIAQASSVIISLFIIRRKTLPFTFKREYIRFNKNIILHELKLGTPIALQELLVGISFLVIQAAVNSIDVVASAGVGVAEKVCAFIMLVPSAFSQSISAFVAQNIGAGCKERAIKALKCGILSSLCVASVIGSFSFFRGDILASIFAKDTEIIMQAFDYLKAYAIDTFLTSILFCFIGYFNGCGNTLFVMLQGIIGAFGVRVPVVLFVSSLSDVSLFKIGLATPCSSVFQILLCIGFMLYLKWLKKRKINNV